MADEIKKVISIDVSKSNQTVKDLRDNVTKLRDVLKTLDSTSEEYKEALAQLKAAEDSLNASMKTNTQQVEAAEGSYNALSRQMRDLKKEWKATNDEATRSALGKEIKGINDQLKALDQSIGNNQRNVGNYAGSFQSLKQEIRDARDVMAGAARGSDEYAEAAKRAAEASDKLRDMQKEIAMGASGLDNRFAVTANLLGSMSGGFAAVQGAMALFGEESEDLKKVFVKLQAAMSMTQGFKALAELPKGLNAAKIAFGGAEKGAKLFSGSLKGVKVAIASTGIGLLVIGLGELVAHWDKVTEAIGGFLGGMDKVREVLAGVANSIKTFIEGPYKALWRAFHGDFKGAWNALKEGWNFTANYTLGVQKQIVKNNEKAEEEKRKEFDKTTDDYIKDMEARKGADWKYTKEGEKAYRDLFANRMKMYKKDSDEYKQAQRDLWTYDRELVDKRKKKPDGGGNTNELRDATEKEIEDLTERLQKIREEMRTAIQVAEDEYNQYLADLKAGLAQSLITQEEYDKELVYITEKRAKAIAEANKAEREKAERAAAEYVQSLKNQTMLELEKFRGELVGNMFPTDKEVELAIKKLDLEEGPFAKYLLGDAKLGEFGIEKFLTDVEKKIQDLQKMSYEYSVSDLLLGKQPKGTDSPGAKEFLSLIDKVKDAVKSLVEKDFASFTEKMNEITRDGIAEQERLVDMSYNKMGGWIGSFFTWRFQRGEEVTQAQIESNNRELASFIATREKELEAIKEQLNVEDLSTEEMTRLTLEAEEIKREEIEKTAEIERKNAEITLGVIEKVEAGKKQVISQTMDAIANTGDFLMNWSDNIVKKETKNGEKMSKEKEKQARAMFNVGKALAISEAVVSTYQGAQEAFTSLASIPYVGPALGIAAAAAAVTAGMLRIQSIASQEFGTNNGVSDNSSSISTTSAVAIPSVEQTPYGYTRNITTAEDESEFNKPIMVSVVDIDDALKARENRVVETSF